MTKKIYFFAVMTALFLLAPATLWAASSGSCGDKVTWTLDNDGVLTIEGTGAMTDYNSMSAVPWFRQSYTKVIIKDGVTTIGSYAFCNCTNLTSVTIPNSVDSIGAGVFSGCTGLASVTIPNSVKSIGEQTFNGCTGLTSVTLSTSLTSIEGGLFYECEKLANVEIPSTVKSIGREAFYACPELASVTIPNSVDSIGAGAFAGCEGLTSVTIPNSVKSIGKGAFIYCYGLTSVTIPESITTIETSAFACCMGLTSITIPASVESIGKNAFSDCTGLTSVTFPKTLTTIGASAFKECEKLTSITIPASVEGIGEEAFMDCTGLTKIEALAKNPPTCGNNAFSGVDKLKCVLYVPATSVGTYMAADEWKDFSNVEAAADESQSGTCGDNITWTLDSDGLLTLEGTGAMPDYTDNRPQWRKKVTKAIIGEGITTIGHYAFEGCPGMTSVTIPNSVTSIEEGAFAECFGLTSVTIPAAVTSIGEVAFYNCIGLTKVVSLAETPPACGENVFAAINFGSCELAVPEKSMDAYKDADGWKDFTKVVSGISSVSKDNNAAVSAKNGAITVTGAANNALVEVYSTSGALVYRGTSKTVAVPSAGVYVVKAAGKTFKVNAGLR